MIHPAPVSAIDPALARGTLREVIPASVTRPAYAVVTFANTDYQLHLVPEGEVRTRPGTRTVGSASLHQGFCVEAATCPVTADKPVRWGARPSPITVIGSRGASRRVRDRTHWVGRTIV